MKRLMSILIIFCLLIPSSYTYAAKTNEKGEVLNLPPFVDFEVKEKKKVDVIVDIGNAGYSKNEINSVINTTLRPQLTAKGLDYNIIVEDTSEGIEHFYFANGSYDTGVNNGAFNNEFFKYNLNSKTIEKINVHNLPTNYNISNNQHSYYDSKLNTLMMLDRSVSIDLNNKTYNPISEVNGVNWNGSWSFWHRLSDLRHSFYLSDGQLYAILIRSQNGEATEGLVTYNFQRNELNNLLVTRENWYRTFYHWEVNRGSSLRYMLAPNGELYRATDVAPGNYGSGYQTGYGWFFQIPINEDLTIENERAFGASYYQGAPMFFLDDNTYLYYKYHYTNSNYNSTIPVAYTSHLTPVGTSMNSNIRTEHYDNMRVLYSNARKMYKNKYDDENQVYFKTDRNGIHLSRGFGNPYEPPVPLPIPNNRVENYYVVDTYGNNILLAITDRQRSHYTYYSDLYLYNIETEQYTFVHTIKGAYNHYNGSTTGAISRFIAFKYPSDYNEKKHLVQDVIASNKHRYDADVYYVRIDDADSEQFMSANQSVEISNLMKANNMTFVGIGSNIAKPFHDNMLNTLDGNGKTFLNDAGIEQSFLDVTEFIVNKKEIELHLLDTTTSPFTDQQITQTINELTRELRQSSYIVRTHYIKQNTNLTNLLDHVFWDHYKNNYVVFLNHNSMSEVNDEDAIAYLASQMNTNYAHFASYGYEGNRQVNENILQMMNERGYYSSTTLLNQFKNELKDYIIQTAESNPKRHISKLVLKHDPKTDTYSSEIELNTFYYDTENDPQKAERFKTEHDPTVYENHTGLMDNTGVYLNSAITRFTKVGKYEIVAQKQDDPTGNINFKNYNLWSEDSLSRLVLYVHRQPVAQFQAYFNEHDEFIVNDLSYDLDNYTKHAKGLMKWNWKYKRSHDAEWIYEKPTNLNPMQEYMVGLRVQDIDEAWSDEVMMVVGAYQKPIAYFEVKPNKASWTSSPNITDYSYSPSGLAITEYNWKVYRERILLFTTQTQPTVEDIKHATIGKFDDPIGEYTIELKVKDSQEQYSDPYRSTFELINYVPIPLFEVPQLIYRDDLVQFENLTGEKDLDGEDITFRWEFSKDESTFIKHEANPQFRFIHFGLGKHAVGRWELILTATDTLNKEGKLAKQFYVSNHHPTSNITGDNNAYLHDVKAYIGHPYDEDSEDRDSLRSYWKITKPSGEVETGYANSYSLSFDSKGSYLIEHWVVDQLDVSSPIYRKHIQVLNKAPYVDFTMEPNPTYRGIDVKFKSLAYDEDGHIASYRFIAENEQGTVSLLSNEREFSRSFSSVGPIQITHTVTDNDGESSSVTKTLHILNRKPLVQITYPNSTSPHSPVVITTRNPNFQWLYSDEDYDEQQQVELRIDHISDSLDETPKSSVLLQQQGKATELKPNNLSLLDNELYKVTARAYDSYDWSNWSLPVYFLFIDNIAPEAGFSISPNQLYEGDSAAVSHRVIDINNDVLKVQYELTTEAGHKRIYPSPSAYYTVGTDEYNSHAFTYKSDIAQIINIKQTVTDEKSLPVTTTRSIVFHPLTLEADVKHTSQWESYRHRYNSKNTNNQVWSERQFYAGEKFMLVAHTTDIDMVNTDSKVQAVKVEAYFPALNKTISLVRVDQTSRFTSEYYEEQLNDLKNGLYTFEFTVLYSNGVIKQDVVKIEIIGKAISFVGVHRLK